MDRRCLSAVIVLALAGCSQNRVPVEANAITLSQAMRDTVDAIYDARAEGILKAREAGGANLGYFPCTITAVFNISATGTVSNKLALGVSGGPPAAIAPVSLNLSGSNESVQSGTRGNTVTLVFASAPCMPMVQLKAPGGPGGTGGTPTQGGGTQGGGNRGGGTPTPAPWTGPPPPYPNQLFEVKPQPE
jgi:hypothetical protein